MATSRSSSNHCVTSSQDEMLSKIPVLVLPPARTRCLVRSQWSIAKFFVIGFVTKTIGNIKAAIRHGMEHDHSYLTAADESFVSEHLVKLPYSSSITDAWRVSQLVAKGRCSVDHDLYIRTMTCTSGLVARCLSVSRKTSLKC
jgi:hypothetical protein